MNDQSRYIVDSRYFDGTCLTFMTDGFRSDFGGETLEEMRVRENNPYLTSVTRQRIDKMLHLYLQALSAPFSEITKEEYHDLMDVLPPIRLEKDSFFRRRTILWRSIYILFYKERQIFQRTAFRIYFPDRTGQTDCPAHGNRQPESCNPERQTGQCRINTLLLLTGRETAGLHLQPHHRIRQQAGKDGYGLYIKKPP